jgi:hypothetical protein
VRPQILCVSFSPIHADSRVLRQVEVLQQHGDVTTVGYGPAPTGVARHIEVPEHAASLPQTPLGVARLALRRHRAVELTSPGEKAVVAAVVDSGHYDLVVANDARALPLAFAADGDKVYADMHEWAAEERATILVWRLLVGPYMEYLCRKYLPRTALVTSVSAGLSGLYRDTYGVEIDTVRNAADFREHLAPTPVDADRIRLVHSGTADVERNIVELIEATERLGERFSLDLYLLEVPGGHLAEIKAKAARSPRVTVHDPVPPTTLPTVLNQYDLGVFLYPLKTLSHLYHLPNKFFDFVQARLGLVFSPAPEIDAHIAKYELGLITRDTSADALVEALQNLTAADVTRFKQASDRSARELSSGPDRATQDALVSHLLGGR